MKKKICIFNMIISLLIGYFFICVPNALAGFEWKGGDIKVLGQIKHQVGLRLSGPNEGKLSMLRTSFQLEPDVKFSDRFSWHAIFRVVKDGYGYYGSEEGWLSKEFYDEDDVDEIFREFYFDIDVTSRLHLKIGRQQVVWGETIGFRMLDLINPLDLSWKFLGEEYEDQRIPLSCLRATFKVQELGGTAELVWIPGFDKQERRVNKFAPASPVRFDPVNWRLFDARHEMAHWNANDPPPPPFITFPVTQVNTDFPELGLDQHQIGFRWSGTYKGFSYSLADFYSFSYSPVAKFRWGIGTFAPTADPATWISGVPVITEVVLDYPRTNMIGGSFNWYWERFNTVLLGEVGYWDALEWNSGNIVPFDDTVVKENTLFYMLGFEGNYWIKPLNRTRTFYINVQMFQKILTSFDKDAQVLEVGAWPERINPVETIFTLFIWGHYSNDRVEPQCLFAYDIDGSWWINPYCHFTMGNHWRARVGFNWFDGTDRFESLGLFRDNDEVYLNLIYQF